MVGTHKAGVYRGAGSAYFTAYGMRQLADEFEIFFGSQAHTAGNDNLRALEVHAFLLEAFHDFGGLKVRRNLRCVFNYFGLPALVGFVHFHDAFPDGGHLRPVIGRDDGRDDVSAERRPDLIENVLVFGVLFLEIADFEVRTVRCKADPEFRGDAGRDIPAGGSGPKKHDLGFVFLDE